jgi:outer membrane protein assembly factor BamD
MARRIVLSLLCGAALLLAGGCSVTKKRLSATEYYTKAGEAFEKEKFSSAADNYSELLDQYPLNPYAEEAQLKVAYAYYLDGSYAEAIAAFSDFERAYPTSTHLPFVEYFRGLCYLRQMRSIDRDQSTTEKAYEFFRTVVDRYVESPFAPLAAEKITECRESLAAHELYVADLYKKYGHYFAAIVRLRGLVERYPETDASLTGLAQMRNILTLGGEEQLLTMANTALEARRSLTPTSSQEATNLAALPPDNLPPAVAGPLEELVTELKRREDLAREQAAKSGRTTPTPTSEAPVDSETQVEFELGEEE